MLKVFVTIDCNNCGQPYQRIAISTDRDPLNWKSLAQDIEWSAESSGWGLSRGAHFCDYCASNLDSDSNYPCRSISKNHTNDSAQDDD